MQKQDFHFDLPDELIAQFPSQERSASRLLVLDSQQDVPLDRQFSDLPELLNAGDLLVFNDTRVIPARLHAHKHTGGKVEILVERILDEHCALAHIRSSKTPRPDTVLRLEDETSVCVHERHQDLFRICFDGHRSVIEVLDAIGHMPLPPYIRRDDDSTDIERYQTVYSRVPGAVAAPTAGLHFDQDMLERLSAMGVEQGFVTLHVGAGTFQPVRVDDIRQHQMHSEWLEVKAELCQQVRQTRAAGGRVIAVGTTAVRALETASQSGELQPYSGETDIFIYPGYSFNIVDAMLTNFHLPESSLLMLVSAFAGTERVLAAYRHAVQQAYRFFSYGDAMFIKGPQDRFS